MELFTGILAVLVLGLVLYLLYRALRDGFYLLLHTAGLQTAFVTANDRSRISAYLQSHPYFMRLSDEGQKRFIGRVFTFMYNKEFRGAEGLVVTEEMKVLISAAAVQLTFGLERYKLANLETIVLFPDIFRLGSRKTEFKGATSGQGTMYLSWQSFREGNSNPTDKVNLGLHEMAHALKLSLSLGSGFDAYFASRIDLWESMATTELERLRNKAEEFLRPYGKTNMAEFFAVCTESFFESPKDFSVQLPELYHYMVFLLNQDPNNGMEDYRVKADYFGNNSFNIPVANEVRKSYKYHSWHWSLSLLLFGVIGGFLSIGYLMHHLILPYYFYILAFAVAGTIGLLQRRYFENHNILSDTFFYFYSYMGFGVSVVTLLLWINFLIPVTNVQEQRFAIKSWTPVWVVHSSSRYGYSSGRREFEGYAIKIEGDDGWYNQTILMMGSRPPKLPASIAFEYRRGIMGIRVLQGYHYAKAE